MKLVDDFKQAWKWFSVQSMAFALAIQGAWQMVPDDLKSSIPAPVVHWTTIVLLVAGLVGRLVKQGE